MARAAGALGVAVTTGLANNAAFAACVPAETAHNVLTGIESLLEALS